MAAISDSSTLKSSVNENGIASYEFDDVVSGTGTTTYYAGSTSGATRVDILSPVTFSSDPMSSYKIISSGGPNNSHDVDFDVTINKPTRITGVAVVDIPMHVSVGGGGTYTHISGAINIQRVRDGTATSIGSGFSSDLQVAAGGSAEKKAVRAALTDTNFKSGDTLRVNVKTWTKTDSATSTATLGHDPSGRTDQGAGKWDSSTVEPILKVQIPVKVQDI